MRYIIYGAGAIGGAIGAGLHEHGHEVVLVARGAHLDALRGDGLTLRTPGGTRTHRIPAVGHPSELAFGADDVVVLAMKSQDTMAALDDLRAAAGPGVPVVCAQNGVANERMAARRFERAYGMLVFLPATFLEPGVVVVPAEEPRGVLDAGRYPAGTDPLIERVCADISASDFSARPEEAVMRLKYAKLLGNLANAVQALCGLEADTRELRDGLRREALACYAAAGIEWTPDEEFRARIGVIRYGDVEGAPTRGSSSWQSLVRGTTTIEADYLNGEIALLGALHGVPAPLNRAVQALAVRAAREGRPPGSMTPEQVMAAAGCGPEV